MDLYDEIELLLTEFGEAVKDDLQQSLRDKGVTYGGGDSRLSAKIEFEVNAISGGISFKLKMPEYGEAVDKGRKSGTPPPIAPIKDWIKRKGILKSEKVVKGTRKTKKPRPSFEKRLTSMAYGISKNIGKKGTIKRFGYKGNNFYSDVVDDGRLEKLQADLTELLKTNIGIEIIDLTKI